MSVVAVERALILLRYMVDHPEGLSIREVSRELGYSPATVQKLIQALEIQGFAEQNKTTDRYHLGPEVLDIGFTALARMEIRTIARPLMEKLAEQTGETIFLGIASKDHAIYIDKVVSQQPIRMDAPLGVNRPYNCTAVGKILLSAKTQDEVAHLESIGAFQEMTERSITESKSILKEIKRIREQGWARDNQEYIEGAGCIAAPIYDHNGNIIAAISATGPSKRINDKLDTLIEKAKETAFEISEKLGYYQK